MVTEKLLGVQAAVQSGISKSQLQEALLLYEHKREYHSEKLGELFFSCLAEVGVSPELISTIRFNYLKNIEYQFFWGGFSR